MFTRLQRKYGELTLENYLQARHLVVTPWNEQRGVIDYQLDKLGLQRDIAIRTPSLLGAPFIVADSELVMSMPRYAAQKLRQAAALDIHPCRFRCRRIRLKSTCTARTAGRRPAAGCGNSCRHWRRYNAGSPIGRYPCHSGRAGLPCGLARRCTW